MMGVCVLVFISEFVGPHYCLNVVTHGDDIEPARNITRPWSSLRDYIHNRDCQTLGIAWRFIQFSNSVGANPSASGLSNSLGHLSAF
jgi:hypothetical protein